MLTIEGDVTFTGLTLQERGGLAGTGRTIIPAGGTLTAVPGWSNEVKILRDLDNSGLLDLQTQVWVGEGALITNRPGGTVRFNILDDGPGAAATFRNEGFFYLQGNPSVGCRFENLADVSISTVMTLGGGGESTGPLEVKPGARLTLQGPRFTLNGPATRLDGLIWVGGELAVDGPLSGTGRLWTDFGGKVTAGAIRLPEAVVNGSLSILSGGGDRGTCKIGTLDGHMRFDLSDHDLIITSATSTYAEYLISHGLLFSSLSGPEAMTALGVLANNNGQGSALYTGFGGLSTGLNDILVGYTWIGDADLTKAIDLADYARLDWGLAGRLRGWSNGDFDYSGAIDYYDYALIDSVAIRRGLAFSAEMYSLHESQFGADYVNALRGLGVPEPVTGLLAVAGACVLLARRRSRRC